MMVQFKLSGLAILAGLIVSPLASAQDGAASDTSSSLAAASVLGSWSSECDAWGTAAICRSVWSEGAHAGHLVQSYTITAAEGDTRIFEGRGVYRFDGDQVDGFWEDSQGAIYPLHGEWADGALSVLWGSTGTAIGRSRYERAGDELTVTDWVLEEDGWRRFMQVQYDRSSR